jgi:pimeloyl-ACP methyl ester carboxylesterase
MSGSRCPCASSARVADKAVKICWGMKGPVFTDEAFLKRLWLDTFPDAEVVRIPDASHFLQEDAHEEVVPELVELVGRRDRF